MKKRKDGKKSTVIAKYFWHQNGGLIGNRICYPLFIVSILSINILSLTIVEKAYTQDKKISRGINKEVKNEIKNRTGNNVTERYKEEENRNTIEIAKEDLAKNVDSEKVKQVFEEDGIEKLTEEEKKGPRAAGMAGKSGVTSQSLALPDGSGTMQGMGESFTPNLNTGSGSFSIPIVAPTGRRGMHPTMGLSYSTGGGNGPLGIGWSMGVPFISRQTDKGMPRYDKSDRFVFNGGQELIPNPAEPEPNRLLLHRELLAASCFFWDRSKTRVHALQFGRT